MLVIEKFQAVFTDAQVRKDVLETQLIEMLEKLISYLNRRVETLLLLSYYFHIYIYNMVTLLAPTSEHNSLPKCIQNKVFLANAKPSSEKVCSY